MASIEAKQRYPKSRKQAEPSGLPVLLGMVGKMFLASGGIVGAMYVRQIIANQLGGVEVSGANQSNASQIPTETATPIPSATATPETTKEAVVDMGEEFLPSGEHPISEEQRLFMEFGTTYYPPHMVPLLRQVAVYAKQFGNDPFLVMEVIRQEYNPNKAKSVSGAVGEMQIMPFETYNMCPNGYCFRTCPEGSLNGDYIFDLSCRPTTNRLSNRDFNIYYGNRMLSKLFRITGSLEAGVREYGPIDDARVWYTPRIMENYRAALSDYEKWRQEYGLEGGMSTTPIPELPSDTLKGEVPEVEPVFITATPEQKEEVVKDACSKYEQVCEVSGNTIIFYKGWPKEVAAGVCASVFGSGSQTVGGCTATLEGIERMDFVNDPNKGVIVRFSVDGVNYYGPLSYFLDCYAAEVKKRSQNNPGASWQGVSYNRRNGNLLNSVEINKAKQYANIQSRRRG